MKEHLPLHPLHNETQYPLFVFENHSNLYFGRIKLNTAYNKDYVRTMYFALASIKDKLLKIKDAENICNVLSELGAIDGAKRKLSAIGKYYLNGVVLKQSALTKFQSTYRTYWNLHDFVEFKESYILSYQEAKEEFEEEKANKAQSRRHSKNAVAESYFGNVDELIQWIKDNIEYISVKVPVIKLEDYDEFIEGNKKGIQKSVAEIKERVIESTNELISEARELGLVEEGFSAVEGQGLYSAWTIKLKHDAEKSMPAEVPDWYYQKKQPSSLDDYAAGEVFRVKPSTITGNPIVKDLVFNYGLKLGKNN